MRIAIMKDGLVLNIIAASDGMTKEEYARWVVPIAAAYGGREIRALDETTESHVVIGSRFGDNEKWTRPDPSADLDPMDIEIAALKSRLAALEARVR
jgi:hypothetical protein